MSETRFTDFPALSGVGISICIGDQCLIIYLTNDIKYYQLSLLHKKLKAINSRALTGEKPCINKQFRAPIMHRSLTFRMQDSGQYSINTEKWQVCSWSYRLNSLRKIYANRILGKMTEQATLNENVCEK